MTNKSQKPQSVNNSGIQATNVKADVLAVGSHARASKTTSVGNDRLKEIGQSIDALRASLTELHIPTPVKEKLSTEIDQLDSTARDPKSDKSRVPGILSRVAGHLKDAGLVVTEATSLGQALRHVADLLGVAWRLFG
jgi:hypothetical protein